VQPNSLFEESACEKCECHGNEYKCEDTCSVEEVTTLSPTSPSPSDCLVCPNVSMSGCTTCNAGLFWNGTTCVARDECPCVVDDLKYAVGSRFLLKDCSDCICRKGGVPQCQAFACQHCENPEYQNEHTSDCNCICKPCPQGFRICPTSRICIREEQWCDGIEDCADDEKDCIEPPPPGMNVNRKNCYLCYSLCIDC
jgi:von Willebrand factor